MEIYEYLEGTPEDLMEMIEDLMETFEELMVTSGESMETYNMAPVRL